MRAPYLHARSSSIWHLEFCKDLGCYRFCDSHGLSGSEILVLGDRTIHLTHGLDTSSFFWRGQHSDEWTCVAFEYDFKKALEWLKQSNRQEFTEYYWLKETSPTVLPTTTPDLGVTAPPERMILRFPELKVSRSLCRTIRKAIKILQ